MPWYGFVMDLKCTYGQLKFSNIFAAESPCLHWKYGKSQKCRLPHINFGCEWVFKKLSMQWHALFWKLQTSRNLTEKGLCAILHCFKGDLIY